MDAPIPLTPEDTRYERLPVQLSFRAHPETALWVCTIVNSENEAESIVLGTIDLQAVQRSDKAKELFIASMREALVATIEAMTGLRPVLGSPTRPPDA